MIETQEMYHYLMHSHMKSLLLYILMCDFKKLDEKHNVKLNFNLESNWI